jgi:glutamyl-tRNA synthetase
VKSDSSQDELIAGIAPLVQERVKLLSEVPPMVRFIFEDPAPPAAADLVPKKTEPAAALLSLKRLSALLPSLGATAEQNEAPLRALAEDLGMKLGDMLMPLRVAVTGSRVSPPLFESMHVMGLEKATARVSRAIAILNDQVTRS